MNLLKSATFARADTSPSATPGSIGDGWIDVDGSQWEIASNILAPAVKSYDNWGAGTGLLLRPTGENFTDGKVRIYPGNDPVGDLAALDAYIAVLRYTGPGTFYAAYVMAYSRITIAKYVSGALSNVVELDTPPPVGNAWYAEFSAVGSTLTLTVYSTADDSEIETATGTDSSIAGPGQWGTIPFWGAEYSRIDGYTTAAVGPPPIVAGIPSQTSVTATTAHLSATDATEGNTPYTYQWYRAQTADFTPGSGNILSGATSRTWTDTGLSPGTHYNYVLGYTDAFGNSVYASQLSVLTSPAVPSRTRIIGFIGDSITSGYLASAGHNAVDVMTAAFTTAMQGTVTYLGNDQGVSGARVGDWVSGSAYLTTALTAFTQSGLTTVSIMLGTNDSNWALSPSDYQTALASTIGALKAAGMTRIILNLPIQGVTDTDATYAAPLAALAAADPTVVFVGDQLALPWFIAHPEELSDGTHPNDTGYASLGNFWATAYEALFASDFVLPDTVNGRHELVSCQTETRVCTLCGRGPLQNNYCRMAPQAVGSLSYLQSSTEERPGGPHIL